MTRVAVLGLGTMGAGMAAQLTRISQQIQVWNRTTSVASKWLEQLRHNPDANPNVAMVAETPEAAVSGADVIITCVSNDAALETVSFGDRGIAAAIDRHAIWLDCGTTGLPLTMRLADAAGQRGAQFLDAPITGSKLGAESGNLTFMVGGDGDTLERVRPLLEVMGRHVVHAGPRIGDGQRIKYCLNMSQSVVLQGVLEGYALARAQGLRMEKLAEVFEHSAGKTGVGVFKTGYLAERDFEPHFKLGLMHKDLGLALGSANAAGLQLPLSSAVEEVYAAAAAMGLGEEDFLATVKVLEASLGHTMTDDAAVDGDTD